MENDEISQSVLKRKQRLNVTLHFFFILSSIKWGNFLSSLKTHKRREVKGLDIVPFLGGNSSGSLQSSSQLSQHRESEKEKREKREKLVMEIQVGGIEVSKLCQQHIDDSLFLSFSWRNDSSYHAFQ